MASLHAEPVSKTCGQAASGENPVPDHLGVHRLDNVAFKVVVHSNHPPGLNLAATINTCPVERNSGHPTVPKRPLEHPVAIRKVRNSLLDVGLQFVVHASLLKGLLLSLRMWCRTYMKHR